MPELRAQVVWIAQCIGRPEIRGCAFLDAAAEFPEAEQSPRALAPRHVHAAPGQRWTVDALAAAVALSPSRFAARFRQTTGQSVMGYVARWRINLACRMLRDSMLTLTEIAHRVGYDSLPAFSRAFKVQLGLAPATWRTAHRAKRGRSDNPAASRPATPSRRSLGLGV